MLQKLGFGGAESTSVLVRCLEALFMQLQIDSSQELLKWTETITEAFFLQLSIFGQEGGQTGDIEAQLEELSYAEDLIERI